MTEFNTKIDFSDCKNEQQFKMKYIKNVLRLQFEKVFCIETEETVKGFPDVMCLTGKGEDIPQAFFYEFKYSNAQGKIKFQPTQPAFYKANNAVMNIWIVAYNKKTNSVVGFPVWDMSSVKGERKYYMNEKAEVQL